MNNAWSFFGVKNNVIFLRKPGAIILTLSATQVHILKYQPKIDLASISTIDSIRMLS